MKKLFIILVVLLNSFLYSQDSVLFVIRVDDIQSRNTAMIPKSITVFQNAVENRGGKVTWAVIPHRLIEAQNSDGLLIKDLKESVKNGHEILLHGYNHICQRCGGTDHEMICITRNSHFTFDEQLKLIDDGLKLIKDSLNYIPHAFVPPAHQADSITYLSLLKRNIDIISTTAATKKNIINNLFNLAPNTEYTWYMTTANYNQQLSSALIDIKSKAKSNGYYCLLLHDPFIREGYENGLVIKWTAELMDSLNLFYGSKIKYATISAAANMFRSQLSGVAISKTNGLSGFNLMQNYPNPFNPYTTISYYIPFAAKVKISIYNLIGQLTALPVNMYNQAGFHEFIFDGSKYSSGVYFCVMQSGSFIQSKKIILLK